MGNVQHINNQELGREARDKLNEVIDKANQVDEKVPLVPTAQEGNVPVFGANGQILDSGQRPGGGSGVNIPLWEDVRNLPLAINFVVQFNGRLFANKIADNQNNQPPLEGENSFWRETSESDSTSTPLYSSGIFREARSEVYVQESSGLVKYVLTVTNLPFISTNFQSELAAGQWEQVSTIKLDFTRTATTVTVEPDKGVDVAFPIASASLAGAITADQFNILANAAVTNGSNNFQGDQTINGNLNVVGNITFVNQQEISTSDNLIDLAVGSTGAGVVGGYGGLIVNRGTEQNYGIVFRESDNLFRVGIFDTLRGDVVSATSNTIVLPTGASAVDDFYNNTRIRVSKSGELPQFRTITDYVGSTRTATIDAAWTTIPDNTWDLRILVEDDTQAVMTRVDSPTNNQFFAWDETNSRSYTRQIETTDINNFTSTVQGLIDASISDPTSLSFGGLVKVQAVTDGANVTGKLTVNANLADDFAAIINNTNTTGDGLQINTENTASNVAFMWRRDTNPVFIVGNNSSGIPIVNLNQFNGQFQIDGNSINDAGTLSNVVYRTSDQSIAGNKIFTDDIHLGFVSVAPFGNRNSSELKFRSYINTGVPNAVVHEWNLRGEVYNTTSNALFLRSYQEESDGSNRTLQSTIRIDLDGTINTDGGILVGSTAIISPNGSGSTTSRSTFTSTLATIGTDLSVGGGIIRGAALMDSWVGNPATNAFFGHAAHNTSNSYGFVQNVNGATFVNAATGQQVILSINGSMVQSVSSSGISVTGVIDGDSAVIGNSSFAAIEAFRNGGNVAYRFNNGTTAGDIFQDSTAGDIVIRPAGTERLRIGSSDISVIGNINASGTLSPRFVVTGNADGGFPGFTVSNNLNSYELIIRGNENNDFQFRDATNSRDLLSFSSSTGLASFEHGISVTGDITSGVALMAPWSGGSTSAFFGHSAHNTSNSYALLQNTPGDTFLNCASGRAVRLGVGGNIIQTITNTGISVAGDINFPGENVTRTMRFFDATGSNRGAYIRYNGTANNFSIGRNNDGSTDVDVLTINRSSDGISVTGDIILNDNSPQFIFNDTNEVSATKYWDFRCLSGDFLLRYSADNTTYTTLLEATRNGISLTGTATVNVGGVTPTITNATGLHVSRDAFPSLILDRTTGGANAKLWQIVNTSDNVTFRSLTDSGAVKSTPLVIDNNGISVTGQASVSSNIRIGTGLSTTSYDLQWGNGTHRGILDFGANGAFIGSDTGTITFGIGSSLTTIMTIEDTGIVVNGTVTATNHILSGSDIRWKKNVNYAPDLGWVDKVKTIEFDWKSTGIHDYGVSAQELLKIAPCLVEESKEGLHVNYFGLFSAKLARHDQRLEALERENIELRREIELLKSA